MRRDDDLPEFGRTRRTFVRLTPDEVEAMDEATKTAALLQREATIEKLNDELEALKESIDRLENAIIAESLEEEP